MRYLEETSYEYLSAFKSWMKNRECTYLGILIHSVGEDTTNIFLLLKQVCLDLHTRKELVCF